MLAASLTLVVVGFVALLLGALRVGPQPLLLVAVAVGAAVLAAVLLAAAVVRSRPGRRPLADDDARWAGAVSEPAHVEPTGDVRLRGTEQPDDGRAG